MPPKPDTASEEEEEDYEDEYETEEGEEDGEEEVVEDVDDEEEEEEEEVEEEQEEEEEEEEEAQPWTGLGQLPEKDEVFQLIEELMDAGKRQLTVLLLGKSGVGKSSTVNSFLKMQVARVSAFKLQADTEIVAPFLRQVEMEGHDADGFRVKLIDTCGLEDPEAGDTINMTALKKIASEIKGEPIDVVLYVDRLDLYRVDALDKGIIGAISDTLGKSIWKKTVLVLTHGNLAQTPPGTDYDSFAARRIKCLRNAIRSPFFRPSLPVVIVENSDTCPVDKEGKRLLPDTSVWMADLAGSLSDVASRGRPYTYKTSMTRQPNNKFKWAVPLVAIAQYYFFMKVLVPILDDDKRVQEKAEDDSWDLKARNRRRLGIGPPLKPNRENAWRLEQIYEDD